jgi:hypothetical protein
MGLCDVHWCLPGEEEQGSCWPILAYLGLLLATMYYC